MHNQPIHFNCDTRIDKIMEQPDEDSIKLDDEVSIHNYYCYVGNNELVKITKIKTGS
jgi:hypothetical protein